LAHVLEGENPKFWIYIFHLHQMWQSLVEFRLVKYEGGGAFKNKNTGKA